MRQLHPETLAIRLQTERTQHREHATPLFNTSSFVFDNAEQMRALFADEEEGNIYSRFSNPNVREFETKMATLEGLDDAFATATGMAAVFAGFAGLLSSGDHILASRALFGSSYTILTQVLPRFGITHTMVDPAAPETWDAAILPSTRMFFVETPSNPGLTLVDLEAAGALAKRHDLILNVDNCFATPVLQNPATFGAHLVTHSATKFIDGQGRVLGGVVIGGKDHVAAIRKFCRNTGPALSPFNAWVLSKSLETLFVRMDRHCDNAEALARHFIDHADLISVNYPFLDAHPQYELARRQMKRGGGLVTMELKGGVDRGRAFLDSLELLSLSANLGDSRTIATHPASTTHSKLTEAQRLEAGITPGLVRISVGLEHVDDVIADIEQALASSR
ncbi:MAG: PLP-dependent transferase [Rhodothermales bacterium]